MVLIVQALPTEIIRLRTVTGSKSPEEMIPVLMKILASLKLEAGFSEDGGGVGVKVALDHV